MKYMPSEEPPPIRGMEWLAEDQEEIEDAIARRHSPDEQIAHAAEYRVRTITVARLKADRDMWWRRAQEASADLDTAQAWISRVIDDYDAGVLDIAQAINDWGEVLRSRVSPERGA